VAKAVSVRHEHELQMRLYLSLPADDLNVAVSVGDFLLTLNVKDVAVHVPQEFNISVWAGWPTMCALYLQSNDHGCLVLHTLSFHFETS
jgi:hypothetical protein